MIEVADIFRLHAQEYGQSHCLSADQRRVLHALQACRTPWLGGHLHQCNRCAHKVYAYHSCRNRHCPKCHGQQTARWLETQKTLLPPSDYYLLTFTLPSELRPLARAQPKLLYGLLMRCAYASLAKLAADPKYVGGEIGAVAVLHTWTRTLLYHPHVHLLVPAGGLSKQSDWIAPKSPAFLVPVRALGMIFRAKMRDGLQQAGCLAQVNAAVWNKPWVVHCQHAGGGQKALDYLARYVFRVAITNSRLVCFQNGQVRFAYRDNRTQQMRQETVSAEQFIGRFLLHVLPKGFCKVRHFGWLSPSARSKLQQVRQSLPSPVGEKTSAEKTTPTPAPPPACCPACHIGQMVLLERLSPSRGPP